MILNKTIGVVGLGLMGTAFAQRLLDAGYPVLGFDRVQEKAPDVAGLRKLAHLGELAALADVIVLAVFDTAQVHEVILGPQGLAAGLQRVHPVRSVQDALPIVCTTTCDPDPLPALGQAAAQHGIAVLEMPVSGTSLQVKRGAGVGLLGGSEALAEQLAPILDKLCPQRFYVGPLGDANRAKLTINLVLGLHRAALAEGLSFGEKLGLDPQRLLALLQNSAAASSVMPVKGPMMVARQYEPAQSRVDQSAKDFKIIQEQSAKVGLQLPLATVYLQLLQSCIRNGESLQDNAIIREAILRGDYGPSIPTVS